MSAVPAFLLGLFLGLIVGIAVAAICNASAKGDESIAKETS